jgi:hypothetical protein
MKSEAKHTPRWEVRREYSSDIALTGARDRIMVVCGDEVIARIPRSWKRTPTEKEREIHCQPIGERTVKQSEKLGLFISVAPELLAFVKASPCECPDHWEDPAQIVTCARCSLIAKAEGRS